MPKYIKDGAYTIVVDERSVSTKRTASPKVNDDSESDDGFGDPRDDELQADVDEWDYGDEEEEKEEEIDYADPAYILQNLKIATPDFSEDKTYMLPCREDLSKIICSQVRFYCYCALDGFLRNPKSVSILIIGEGFIGARIINDLISNGCKEALRVCTRGDLTAEEWRARGIKADNDLPALLNGEQPEIVIITVENASFTTICRQLTANYVLSASSFIISCSFGFQRRKLYAQLHTPNIFRSFVEPEQIYSKYKKNAFSSIVAFTKTEIVNMMTDSMSMDGSTKTAGSLKPTTSTESAALPEGVTKEEYNGAEYMATRSLDVRNIVFQLENFYAIQHHGFSEARRRALKNVFGVYFNEFGVETVKPSSAGGPGSMAASSRKPADETYEAMSIRKAMKTEAKLRSRLENMLRKLGDFNACALSYQTYFSNVISPHDMQALKAQQYTKEENNPKSGPNLGFQKYKHNPGEPPAAARKTVADLPGRPMYDADFITAIFRNDEDYSNFTGPGFDLMTSWDKKPDKKMSSKLKQLQSLTGNASSDSSVVSGAARSPHNHHPPPQHHVNHPAGHHPNSQGIAHAGTLSGPHGGVHNGPHGGPHGGHHAGHHAGHHGHHSGHPDPVGALSRMQSTVHGHIRAGGDSSDEDNPVAQPFTGAARNGHSVHPSRVVEPLSEEAAQELAEFGQRISRFADTEGTKIDRNYMQKYLEVSSSNLPN